MGFGDYLINVNANNYGHVWVYNPIGEYRVNTGDDIDGEDALDKFVDCVSILCDDQTVHVGDLNNDVNISS